MANRLKSLSKFCKEESGIQAGSISSVVIQKSRDVLPPRNPEKTSRIQGKVLLNHYTRYFAKRSAASPSGEIPMIHTKYIVYPHDSIYEAFVLRPEGEGKLVVMAAYQDLVCQTCGKVDERTALARGIHPEVTIKSKRPMLISSEGLYLVNERTKNALFGTCAT